MAFGRGGGGGANSSDSTQSCRTSYQDGEEMVTMVQPECLFLKSKGRRVQNSGPWDIWTTSN